MGDIRLRGLSKVFAVSHEKPTLLRELMPRLMRSARLESRWALRDVDLDVAPGTSLGIVGPNGAGKTTLLSLIAGVLKPTSGTVHVDGRVATVLALGSGFHPELTGRQNVFLNGAILGMSTREIRRKLDAIVAFSELEASIDAPLRTYSSGMQLRLGFAIAAHSDFDILLLDEFLTVGDVAFQEKCLRYLEAARAQGKTLVMVSQVSALIEQLCDRAVLLVEGRLAVDASPHEVTDLYLQRSLDRHAQRDDASVRELDMMRQQLSRRVMSERFCGESVRRRAGTREGTGAIEISGVEFLDSADQPQSVFQTGDRCTVRARFIVRRAIPQARFGVAIFREADFAYVYGTNTMADGLTIPELAVGMGEVRLTIEPLWLLDGAYRVSAAWWDAASVVASDDPYAEASPYDYHIGAYAFQVIGPPGAAGVCYLPHQFDAADAGEAPSATLCVVINTGDPLMIGQDRAGSSRPARCVRIIREDGLECFSVLARGPVRIMQLNLLPARYWVCVDDRRPQELLVRPGRLEHGCVSLGHRWSLHCPGPQEALMEARPL